LFQLYQLVISQSQSEAEPSALVQFAPIILIFVVIYFIMLRPQRKQQKAHQEMLDHLQRGDEVITQSGILGRITAISDNKTTVTLEIADKVKIKMLRSHVTSLKNNNQNSKNTTQGS